jgi:hypothetical protein
MSAGMGLRKITVLSYAAGSADSVVISSNLGYNNLVEGVAFNAVTDNATTAANIATAINGAAPGIRAVAVGADVLLTKDDSIYRMNLGSTDAAAWSTTMATDGSILCPGPIGGGVQIGQGAVTTSGGVAIGDGPAASGDRAIAFGYGSTASDQETIAIGDEANASDAAATAIGNAAQATHDSTVAIGHIADASKIRAIAIGPVSVASGDRAIAFGYSPDATANDTIAMGNGAQATDYDAIAIGKDANASGHEAIAIGDTATSANEAVAIGEAASAFGGSTVAVGRVATATTGSAVAVGAQSVSSGSEAVAVGYRSIAYATGGTALGTHALSGPGSHSLATGSWARCSRTGVITVVDYTQGAGDTITVDVAGDDTTILTEGVDFNAVTDNDTTAENIRAALGAILYVNATRVTNVVTIESPMAALTGSDAGAWTVSLTGTRNRGLAIGKGAFTRDGEDSVAVGRKLSFCRLR